MDLAVGRDELARAVEQHARVEDPFAVAFEDAPAVHPDVVSLGELGQAIGARPGDGLGRFADLLRRALPRPDLRQRSEVGPLNGGPLEKPEHLLLVGGDVFAAIRLAEGYPHRTNRTREREIRPARNMRPGDGRAKGPG